MAQIQTNLAWDTLLDLDARSGPLHARLTRALREAIQSGRVPSGSALPPTRVLADTLRLSRWTVTEAYEQLAAEGYVSGRVGSGTRVRWHEENPAPASGPVRSIPTETSIDLAPGLPDLRAFPRERWLAAMRSVAATAPHTALGYPERGGEPELRELLASYLRRVRGADVASDDITITSGVTDGVTRACRVLLAAGVRRVAVEDPGWTKLRNAIGAAGLETIPVPVDSAGLDVERLAAIPEAGAAVISPAHQFPTGSVLSPERRSALLAWAADGGRLVLEDDYDAEFRYDRRPVGTLQGADPAHVALLGSLSKTLAPALAIGWIATPPGLTARLRESEVRVAEPPVLDQRTFARFLATGDYDRHLRAARKRYRVRRDRLVAALALALPRARVAGAAAGLHLLLHFDHPLDTRRIVARARSLGVQVATVEQYRVTNESLGAALVLGYGNLGDGEVEAAVAVLARAVGEVDSIGDVR